PVAGEALIVLDRINLHVEKGEFIAIMGPSGAGKSTLMNIIGCLDQRTSGTFELNGELISEYDDKQLAKIRNQSIGFVFQQFHLLPRMTALENVELPLIYAGVKKAERMRRAKEALAKVGLSDRMEHLPNELSGGQKQRVAIARAIVNEPDIILADEPTGALDSKTGKQIMELFTLLNEEGTTVIVVTHEAEVASYAKRTIFVRDGKVTSAERVVDQELSEKIVEKETFDSWWMRKVNVVENIKMAISSLRAQKMRSLLTLLGIIIGGGSVIAVVAIGQGGEAVLKSQFAGEANTRSLFYMPTE